MEGNERSVRQWSKAAPPGIPPPLQKGPGPLNRAPLNCSFQIDHKRLKRDSLRRLANPLIADREGARLRVEWRDQILGNPSSGKLCQHECGLTETGTTKRRQTNIDILELACNEWREIQNKQRYVFMKSTVTSVFSQKEMQLHNVISNKGRWLANVVGLFCVLFAAGCGTVFTGTKDKVTFSTNPQGAKVLFDRKEIGVTPLTAEVPRRMGKSEIEYQLDGYKKASSTFEREFNTVCVFNITLWPGWLVDIASGSINRAKFFTYSADLELRDQQTSIVKPEGLVGRESK